LNGYHERRTGSVARPASHNTRRKGMGTNRLLSVAIVGLVAILPTPSVDKPPPPPAPPNVVTPPDRISAPVFYDGQMLVLTTDDGVAAVAFGKEIDQGVRYRFRYLPANGGKEESGKDKVFEKYKRVPGKKPGEMGVVDVGSRLMIQPGPIRVEWSMHGKGTGWIYYRPEDLRVQIANARDFEKIDLQRFAK
jgi:hypothetical protein